MREAKNAANKLMVENSMSETDDSEFESGEESNPAEDGNKTKTETNNAPIKLEAKKYGCPFCSKVMAKCISMKCHILTHTGEKPFNCIDCDKAFNQQSTLNRHMLVHTGEKPFTCNECGKAFAQKHNLANHVMIHTGEKPFSCNFCDYSCIQKSDVKKHVKSVHNKIQM